MEMAPERHEMTTAFAGGFTELPGEPAYLWLFNYTHRRSLISLWFRIYLSSDW